MPEPTPETHHEHKTSPAPAAHVPACGEIYTGATTTVAKVRWQGWQPWEGMAAAGPTALERAAAGGIMMAGMAVAGTTRLERVAVGDVATTTMGMLDGQ